MGPFWRVLLTMIFILRCRAVSVPERYDGPVVRQNPSRHVVRTRNELVNQTECRDL